MEEMILSLPSESPSCVLCHQKFFNRSSLRRHMERHLLTNRRRFQCDICFKLFCRKDYVREHKQHMHGMRVESRVVDSECKNTE
ncbi:hypothetical protein TNCV_24571 [Trichonephila clavipes]|nr:hypothetical protein TNCV_24571 [Trichonephila clavipes]